MTTVLLAGLWACTTPKSGPDRPDASIPGGDADTTPQTDTDTDTDTDTGTGSHDDADGDGFPADQDCDDTNPTVRGMVTVDNVPFGDLASALAAASDGSTVLVECSRTFIGPFVATVAVNLEAPVGIDAPILSGADAVRVLELPGGSTLTGLTIQGGRTSDDGGGLLVTTAGPISISNCAFQDNQADNGGGIALDPGSTATLSGTTLSGNQATNGGGGLALAPGSTATLSTTTIRNNQAADGGGVLVPAGATLDLGDSVVKKNTASHSGGGIALADGSKLLNGDVSHNTAASAPLYYSGGAPGGGVFATGSVEIDRTSMSSNTGNVGGGLAVIDGDAVLVDVEISDNGRGNGYAQGGGAYCESCSLTCQGDPEITDNEALEGGGVYLTNGTMTGGHILNNVAVSGGGLYLAGGTATSVEISGNGSTATWGGGIYATDLYGTSLGDNVVQSCTVQANSGLQGGGLLARDGTIDLLDSVLEDNTATTGGGVYAAVGLHAERSQLLGNFASLCGGGVATDAPWDEPVELVDSTVAGNSATCGGGAWATAEAQIDSTDTDWGTDSVTADNIGGDVYLSQDYPDPSFPDAGQGYDYEGTATFSCDVMQLTCQ